VADLFGCKGLKLLVEAELVASGISVGTAADLIIVGDARNCALLKEATTDFCAANLASVMSSPGWGKVEESLPLMKELMALLTIKTKRSAPAPLFEIKSSAPANGSDKEHYKRMRVSTLR
jgi:hypothetical protein